MTVSSPPRIAIVGGGITGLSAAYFVRKTDPTAQVIVLEASHRVGGKIRSVRRTADDGAGPFLLEEGADAFLARQKPWAFELAHELGLSDRLQSTDERNSGVYIVNEGGLVRLPAGLQLILPTNWEAFQRSPLLSEQGKRRIACERAIPPRMDEGDESVADFVTRRFGVEATQKLAEPLLAGIYSADPTQQSILATFPRFRRMEKEYGSLMAAIDAQSKHRTRPSPRGPANPVAASSTFVSFLSGTEELPRALAAEVSDTVRLNTAVLALQHWDGVFILQTSDGQSLTADRVLLALPADAARMLLRTAAPEAARLLGELRTVSSGVVYLAYRAQDVPHPLDAFGVVVPAVERRNCNALTFASSKFSGRAPEGYRLIRYFFGGARTPHLLDQSDDGIARIARKELSHLLAVEAEPVLCHVVRWRNAQPQYDVGHLERMNCLQQTLPEGLLIAGTAYGGVGIPDCIRQAQNAAVALCARQPMTAGGSS